MTASAEPARMDHDQKALLHGYFQKIPFFQSLANSGLEKVTAKMHFQHLHEGQRLYQQGARGESLALLSKGQLRVVMATESGIEVTLGLREAGSVVGEMALLDGQPRSASVEATRESEVWLLAEADFFKVLEDNPSFARHLLRMVSSRLREAGNRIKSLANGSIRHRLAKFLADQAVFQGKVDGLWVRLPPLTPYEMGHVLGLERRNVSRALNALRNQKLIDGDQRGIVILDLHALRDLAQQVETL